MNLRYINYANYESSLLICNTPERKMFQDQSIRSICSIRSSPYYYRMPIWYQYGACIDSFLIEGCEIHAKQGIIIETLENGFMQYKIPCIFDTENRFLEVLRDIYWKSAVFLHQNRGGAKITGYPTPFGDPNQIDLNLYSRKSDQSLFTDPQGNVIPWKLLFKVQIKFIPLLRIKHVHIMDGNASLQMEIVSAIVTALNF